MDGSSSDFTPHGTHCCSVGTPAIRRFLRPFCYQNMSDVLLSTT